VVNHGHKAPTRARLVHVDQYYLRADTIAAANAWLIVACRRAVGSTASAGRSGRPEYVRGDQGTGSGGEKVAGGGVGEAEDDTLAQTDQERAQRCGQALRLSLCECGPVVEPAGQQPGQAFFVCPDGGGEPWCQFGVAQDQVLQADLERQMAQLVAVVTEVSVLTSEYFSP
jgi:hypothetical protein